MVNAIYDKMKYLGKIDFLQLREYAPIFAFLLIWGDLGPVWQSC